MNQPQSQPAWIGFRALFSLLATLAGWAAGGVFYVVLCVIASPPEALVFELLMYGIITGVLLLIIWLILILPISLFVPSHSLFWQPARLTLIGMVISQVIGMPYYLWQQIRNNTYSSLSASWLEALSYGILLAIIGGVIGFVAAILNRRS